MLDFMEFAAGQNKKDDELSNITTAIFYRSSECMDAMKEAFVFEGWATPEVFPFKSQKLTEYTQQQQPEILIIDFSDTIDLIGDIQEIHRCVPNNISVVIIGSQDSILLKREVEETGFYYLFWPTNKHEIIEFIKTVRSERCSNQGLGQARKAKKVSIVGSKGGCGSTFLTTEITHQLSNEKKSSCLLVDNHYVVGNVDIMLALKNFQRRSLTESNLLSNLDVSSAENLTQEVTPLMSVLALDKDADRSASELREYSDAIADVLSSEVNFIIQDLSSDNDLYSSAFLADSDVIVILLEPTVSSVRNAAVIKQGIEKTVNKVNVRFLIVVNNTMPKKYATVTKNEIEKLLDGKINVEVLFDKSVRLTKLEGKYVYLNKTAASQGIKQLTAGILGQVAVKKRGLSLFSRVK